jgi:hypothetical protein
VIEGLTADQRKFARRHNFRHKFQTKKYLSNQVKQHCENTLANYPVGFAFGR